MKNITIIGSGTMGSGIAHTFAQHGFNVSLTDLNQQTLIKAINTINDNLDRQFNKGIISLAEKDQTLKNIQTFTNMEEAVLNADLVIEAATENIDTKLALFKKLDKLCKQETILASNTSSLPITKLASVTNRPDRVIGMHFMNPVPVMILVEVIRGHETSDKVCTTIMELSKSLGKTPVEVNDSPGFIANRILMPMINESIYALYEGVAGKEEIDQVMKLGMAHPMGPLQLADFIGLDVCLAIIKVLRDGFDNPKYEPCPLLVSMVNAGTLGKKTKQGFYTYE
jgi:3-hydroxybutyryl-CoA dehydrogenase